MTCPIELSCTDPNHRRPLVTIETPLYPLSEFTPEEAAKVAEFEAAPDLPESYRPSSPVALLDQLDELRAKATPGPWFFNGYSAVMSQPRLREYNDAESLLPEDAPDDAYDGLPEYLTATVPIAGGDTATRQGAADAALIVAAVNAVGPLTAAVRAVLELADEWEMQARRHDWAEPLTSDGLFRAIAAGRSCREHAAELRAALSVTP